MLTNKERMNYLKTQIEEARAILDAASDIRDGTMLRFEAARAAYEIANEQHVAARAAHADALARSFSLKEAYWAAEKAAAEQDAYEAAAEQDAYEAAYDGTTLAEAAAEAVELAAEDAAQAVWAAECAAAAEAAEGGMTNE